MFMMTTEQRKASSLSVPLSIRLKSFSPLVIAAVTASGLDYYLGMRKCSDLKQNIDRIKEVITLNTFDQATLESYSYTKKK